MIESYGSTSVSDGYVLITGFGFVSLKYGNFDVTPGQFAGWTLIGAEKTADGGYEVAWKTTASNQYTVWNTDSNGNYVSNIGVVSAKSLALESLEPSFQQDLNGDGTTGLVTSVIETFGSTKLVRVEDQYFMYAVGGSTGPAVKVNGLAVTLAQMGRGRRSARRRRQADTRSPGSSRAPITTRSGTPTAAATTSRTLAWCLATALC
jgi:serralysin